MFTKPKEVYHRVVPEPAEFSLRGTDVFKLCSHRAVDNLLSKRCILLQRSI